MKYLFVIPYYHMASNANNNCTMKIIEELKANGHDVDIMSVDNKGDVPVVAEENGCRIYTFFHQYNYAALKLGKYVGVSDFRKLPKIIQLAVKTKCYIKTIFRPRTDNYPVDAIAYRKIFARLKEAGVKYDVVVSHSFPFAAHTIAKEIRKRRMADKWFAIKWDPYVYNKLDPERTIPARKITAERVLHGCDGILISEGIMEENMRNGYDPAYHQITTQIAIPIMQEQKMEETAKYDVTTLTYAGAFYSDIRRPDEMLKVLSCFPSNYQFVVYGYGCKETFDKMESLFQDCKLVRKGRVMQEEALKGICASDILVNLGNTITNQLPSKVFEYISFGKPIINFYSIDEDLGLKYLKNYPLCYNFKTIGYTEEDIKGLIEFCDKNKNKRLPFEIATEKLVEYRAENVCRKISEILVGTETLK